jgi:uncharacterized membrane protein YhiD involved in acid resistance
MDELIKEMERFKDHTAAFTVADIAIAFLLTFLLSAITAFVYRATHRGTSYSQSFAQTLVMMATVTAMIMLIIGSNIARAFSLVGALSVIRFRNAVKETRDIGFMFMAMALGMACGTGFYGLAIFATVALSAAMLVMFKTEAFERRIAEQMLRVRMPADRDADEALEPVFREHVSDARLVSMETVAGGVLQELVYTVVIKQSTAPHVLLEEVRRVTDNNKVALVVGQQEVDL